MEKKLDTYERDQHGQRVVACELCGKPTIMLSTQRCDGCWELERRVQNDPDIALRVLAKMNQPSLRISMADTYLHGIMRRTGELYTQASKMGEANGVLRELSQIERAARALHAMATVPLKG